MESGLLEEDDIREVFDTLDTDGSGLLDLDEFEVACRELQIPDDKMEHAFQVVSGIKRRKVWRDMDQDTQLLWTALGWTENLWENEGKANTEESDWEDLFPSQRKAAERLGYSRRQWDTEGDGDDAIPWEKFLSAISNLNQEDVFAGRLYKSEASKRRKIEQIRSDIASREKGTRNNYERIEAIRNRNNLGGSAIERKTSRNAATTGSAGGSSTFSRQRSKDRHSSSAKKPTASPSPSLSREERVAKLAKIRTNYGI